jgi:hypothetical protein
MSLQPPTDPAGDLPRLLFQSTASLVHGDEIEQAITTAAGRWPVLQASLEGAAKLVRAHGVCKVPAEAQELALVKPSNEWTCHAVSPSPTGVACSCDGWPPATHAGPGDGRYCADILAYLLTLYLERPFAPLPFSPASLWQETLDELRVQMTRATFDQWLRGSTVVAEASTPLSLTVAVRNRYAQAWLTHRLHGVIVRALATVAGCQVKVRFVVL